MVGRGNGRGRSQSEYLTRYEGQERRSGTGANAPSCSLWVGSLSSHVTRSLLSEHFMRFGEIENIGFIPGRNFAFVNFKKVEDAIIAMQDLQGYNLGGMALKIEFAKADKSSTIPRDEGFSYYSDSEQSVERAKPLLQRDLRPILRPSPEKPYEKAKGSSSMSNNSTDPSEMLWIGFPPSLNVDEAILRRAFSPFGEIVKVSTFPGRAYAFVQFKTILSACRAKEALQGKLFNNPRVNICFAKNEGLIERGRGPTISYPLSRRDPGGVETFQREKGFESPFRGEFRMSSPGLPSNFNGRNTTIRASLVPESNISGIFEERRVELGSKRRMVGEPYQTDRLSSDRPAPWLDFSFGKARSEKVPPSHDDLFEPETGPFAMVKKIRTDTLHDNELPDYPFSSSEHGKHRYSSRIPKIYNELSERASYDTSLDSPTYGIEGAQGLLRNIRRNEQWERFDSPSAASGFPAQKFIPELQKSPVNSNEWKWEGRIAKGGATVCNARCFPVGKVLDFELPDVLNCTARTDLEMLSKHYYQAASTWVVFFVPGSDSDINLYNEFMHLLGEKKRAAVVKLDEKVSLFLVPPSDFSEQVLKVPGKVSISGVVLKFPDLSSSTRSTINQMEAMKPKHDSIISSYDNITSVYGDSSFSKQRLLDPVKPFSQDESLYGASSRHGPPLLSFPPPSAESDFYNENRRDKFSSVSNVSSMSSFIPSVSRSFGSPRADEYAPITSQSQPMILNNYSPEVSNVGNFALQKQEASSPGFSNVMSSLVSNFGQQNQEAKSATTSAQLPLHPDQLAQLASILGQQKQFANLQSHSETNKQSVLPQNPNPHSPMFSHPEVSNAAVVQKSDGYQVQPSVGSQVHVSSQQAADIDTVDQDSEAQKRLQATLQLAAQLLQQIHQPKKQ